MRASCATRATSTRSPGTCERSQDAQVRAALGENARTRRAAADARGDDAEARAHLQGASRAVASRTSSPPRPPREASRPRQIEAPPLHGDDGLDSETLPHPPASIRRSGLQRRGAAPSVRAQRCGFAIVRAQQKYTPYGGAERFVERALAALAARDVEITLVTRQWPDEREPAHHAARSSTRRISGAPCATRGFAHAACTRARRAPGDARAVARAHRMLRHLSRRRRRARRVGRGAHARCVRRAAPGARGERLSPLHAGRGTAAFRKPAAEAGDLHLADGAGRDSRALRPAARAPAGDLQRDRSAACSIPGLAVHRDERARALRHRRTKLACS